MATQHFIEKFYSIRFIDAIYGSKKRLAALRLFVTAILLGISLGVSDR